MPYTKNVIQAKLRQLQEELTRPSRALSLDEAIDRTMDIILVAPFTQPPIALAVFALETLTHKAPTVVSVTQAVSKKITNGNIALEHIVSLCKKEILLRQGDTVTIHPDLFKD
ncbi:MAG: hypothetical protein WC505_00085 [Patescibacteria group bacterium]